MSIEPKITEPQRSLFEPEMRPTDPCVGILDFGSQTTPLIRKTIQSLGVRAEVIPFDTSAGEAQKYSALVLSGSRSFVSGDDTPQYDQNILNTGKPTMGICYGMQLMAHHLGGNVERLEVREDGPHTIVVDTNSPVFNGLNDVNQLVHQNHGDSVTKVPIGWKAIASSNGKVDAMVDPTGKMVAFQFHPEVAETVNGKRMFENFLFKIAKLKATYLETDWISQAVTELREKAGGKRLLCFSSGGVDSSLAAILSQRAVGTNNFDVVLIDDGLLREGEVDQVRKTYAGIDINLQVVDAADQFFTALAGVTNAEQKRQITGDLFVKVMIDLALQEMGDTNRIKLVWGSLKTDAQESGQGKNRARIKTHHNYSDKANELRRQGLLLEPNRELVKDQVRVAARTIGLPKEISEREPSPGPGFAIRVITQETPFMEPDYDAVQEQMNQELRKNKAYDGINASLLPVRAVGVQGDDRSYNKYFVVLSGKLDWSTLKEIAYMLPDKIQRVNRVGYLFGEPIEGAVREITPESIRQARLLDLIAREEREKFGLRYRVSQWPIGTIPVGFGIPGYRSVVSRPFITAGGDFYTGNPAIPGVDIPEEAVLAMNERFINEVPGIARSVIDLTPKPPGTVELE